MAGSTDTLSFRHAEFTVGETPPQYTDLAFHDSGGEVAAADPQGTSIYRVGGVAAVGVSAAYIIILVLYASVGAPPGSGDPTAWLRYLMGKTTVWWAILALSVLTDLLFVPIGLSLYLALERDGRHRMLVATAFVGLFVVLDLAVTWSNYASLLTLGSAYAAAANDVERSAYVVAAHYPAAVLTSRLFVVYAIVVLSFAILLIGCVMLEGMFSRITAYLGIITGTLGIISIGGWAVTIIINAMCTTVWVLLVGVRLYRLGRE
jgi:hypothetical protein